MSIRSVTTLLPLLALSMGLYAQDRATLTGTVTDPSGASIPTATIRATNTATNQTSETKTTTDGVYTIPYLSPGLYDIEVAAAGFQTLKRQSIVLEVAQRLVFPVQLTVGQATTEITVTGQQEVTETGDASRGLVFDPVKTQEYPLNGRQSYMLLMLTPGVIFTQEQFGASGFSGTRAWDVNNSYKFNGARAGNGNNVFMLNGTPISNEGSTWEFAPSIDAIQEFKAMTTVYDASYGHEAGGVVNTVIRGGSNNWHGDVYDYFRNAVMDANNFGNNVAGAPKGNHQQNQFGGVFGGPLRKDKDFLFTSYEGWQESIPFPGGGITDVPLAMRDGQHWSQFGMTVFDPLTTHACDPTSAVEPCTGSNGSAYWRNPFPGNVIPQSRISPVGTKILSYLPAPNSPGQGTGGIANDYLNAANHGRYWYNQEMARWDHNFGEKDKFYALFSQFHGFEYRSSTTYAPPLATGNSDNNRTFTGLNLDETHMLSPTAVLDVKLSFMRFVQLTPGYTAEARAISPASIGMTGMIQAPTVSDAVIPNINIGGFTGALFGSGSISWSPYNRWAFMPSVTKTKGAHALRFGFEYGYESRGNVSLGNAYGSLTFGSGLTQQATGHASTTNGGVDQYMGVASLLLGIPTSGNIDNNATSYGSRPYYAVYAQDDWRLTPRLTINIGLRYELQLGYLERYNRMTSQFDISTKNPLSDQIEAKWNQLKAAYDATNPAYPYPAPPPAFYGVWRFAGVDGYPRRQHYTDYTTGAPRFGFAYSASTKTVLRGGIGVFYQSDTATGNNQTGFSASTGYLANVASALIPSACDNNNCANGAPVGPYSIVNPFPNGLISAPGSANGLLSNLGLGSTSNPLHWKTPRTYQYSFGVQRALPRNMLLDVSFAGNYALYDRDSQDLGHLQNAAGYAAQNLAIQDPTFFSRQLTNPFQGILPSNTSLGSSATQSASSLMNYYSMWGGYTQADVADRNFRSDALQVRYEKRALADRTSAAGVLTWVVSWTFGKQYSRTCCIGQSWSFDTGASLVLSPDGSTGKLVTHPNQNNTDNLVYALDSNQKTQEFAFSGVWDLPVGKGRYFFNSVHGTADKILTGWTIPWTATYISGWPVGLPGGINFCGDYTHYTDPSTGQVVPQNWNHWFNNNPKCYANFAPNVINSGLPPRYSNINNPAAAQYNVAIEKYTKITERYNLQFRAEAFNISNTPIRPAPSSTSFTSATFGIIPNAQQNFPRLVELVLKLNF
ncbi:MAG TPA: TonB-dependent receptor [Bryobacteraceae bacterium]|nr:TonB-dependent receptor [Bryobacteraceae bacterium]